MEIVLATRNRRKVEEVIRIMVDLPILILTLDDFPACPETEEDGATFEENAVKKAITGAKCAGKPSLADDSGLEVYALKGAPGVFSSRYAGPEANDRKNIEKLLNEMRFLEGKHRKARFVCCIALAFPDGKVHTFYGYTEGLVGTEPRGGSGFGYDPIFYPEGRDKTFAEMTAEEKDAISHRGRALREVRDFLISRMEKKI
ncbi:MAG: XTP/dITP diphosphatase [Nitrospirota bacterium]